MATKLSTYSLDQLLLKRRSLRRELLNQQDLKKKKVAVLGGSTTNEVVNLMELYLLEAGLDVEFYQADYGQYYESAVLDPKALIEFKPDIVYIHTSNLDIRNYPSLSCSEEELPSYINAEVARYAEIWDSIENNLGCQVIQNNFELSPYSVLGNMDAVSPGGKNRFILELNAAFARVVNGRKKVLLQDIQSMSARVGLKRWFDWDRYFSYKVLYTSEANAEIARSFTSLVVASYGGSKKVLVLDLDNTLWGGVIGDDGVEKIQIGRETPVAEAYTAFQEYCLSLRERGILLAVCSKNTESIAQSGFEHPSSVLKLEHFSSFKANWQPKHENILAIAKELNLGVDSFVFVDDNPAERAIVEGQLPGVAVPDVGSEVSHYAGIIESGRYFEPVSLSKEDLERAGLYQREMSRAASESKFADYGEYLDSLEMVAEIATFKPVYLERITQLTNKTNQFNVTTRRYTQAEIESIATDPDYVAIYGRLSDRFGDNGLIAVTVGQRKGQALTLDLWLMSCRVLKREMEFAMLDEVVRRAQDLGVTELLGTYLPTKKNGMVASLYKDLGFEQVANSAESLPEGSTSWRLSIDGYKNLNTHIRVQEEV